MAKIENRVEDYVTSPVPESKTVGGFSIGMINGNLAFAVPGLITGIEVGAALGIAKSLMVFFVGGLILSVLATITGLVGRINRLSSYMTMKFVFGEKGANFITFAFILSLLGWYGVNIDLFSEVMLVLVRQEFGLSPPIWLLEVLLGILITCTTIWGFRILERISSLFVPVLAVILFVMLYQVLEHPTSQLFSYSGTHDLSFGQAVSIVVGSFVVSVVLMPDFTRFAKTSKDVVVASFLPFMGLSSFVYIISAMAGIVLQETDILNIMLTLGLGFFAFLLLIISSWVTNVVNLYSIGLGLNAIKANTKEWKLIVLAGVLGTLASTLNLLNSFTDFLFGLSIIFTPVAAIYVVNFFIVRRRKVYKLEALAKLDNFQLKALLVWGLGVISSYLLTYFSFTFSGIEAVDAFALTALFYLLANRK